MITADKHLAQLVEPGPQLVDRRRIESGKPQLLEQRLGLQAQVRGRTVREIALQRVALAADGLAARKARQAIGGHHVGDRQLVAAQPASRVADRLPARSSEASRAGTCRKAKVSRT